MTGAPEDMFNAAHIQLGVARDGLPGDMLAEAVTAALQVLADVQRRSHDFLTRRWRLMDPLRLCAIANDNRRMQGGFCVYYQNDKI